jgi:hypothetical protein
LLILEVMTAAVIFAPTFAEFKRRQREQKALTGKAVNFPSCACDTLMTTLRNMPATSTEYAQIMAGEVIIQTKDEKNAVAYMLMSACRRLLESDRRRFGEINAATSPPGTIFALGHSLENYHRTFRLWQLYSRCRNMEKKAKYSFSTSGAAQEPGITIRLRFFNINNNQGPLPWIASMQDPALSVALRARDTPASLTTSKEDAALAFRFLLARSKTMFEYRGEKRISPMSQKFISTVAGSLMACAPYPIRPKGALNPRPQLGPSAYMALLCTMRRMANAGCKSPAVVVAEDGQPVMAIPPLPRLPTELASDIGFDELIGDAVSHWRKNPKGTLRLRFRRMALFEEDAIQHDKIMQLYDMDKRHLKEYKDKTSGDPWAKDQVVTNILQATAVNVAIFSLLSATETSAGLLLVKDLYGYKKTNQPLVDNKDRGASFIYQNICTEKRTRSPATREEFVEYLVASSPIMARMVTEVGVFLNKAENKGAMLILCGQTIVQQ